MTEDPDIRIHAIWGVVVVSVVLLIIDGQVATTIAGAVIAGLAGLAGFTYGRSDGPGPSNDPNHGG